MKKKVYNFFINIVFLGFVLYISKMISLNYLWGSINGSLTFFQGAFPAISNLNPYLFIFYILLNLSNNFIFKIPSFVAAIIFFILNKIKREFFYLIFSFFSLLFIPILLITKYKIPVIFFSGSILSLFLIFIFKKNYLLSSFISIWVAHSVGTLIYVIMKNPLSYIEYTLLAPISFIERLILSLIFYFIYIYIVKFQNMIFNSFIYNYNYRLLRQE
jgi:hypothetical protein